MSNLHTKLPIPPCMETPESGFLPPLKKLRVHYQKPEVMTYDKVIKFCSSEKYWLSQNLNPRPAMEVIGFWYKRYGSKLLLPSNKRMEEILQVPEWYEFSVMDLYRCSQPEKSMRQGRPLSYALHELAKINAKRRKSKYLPANWDILYRFLKQKGYNQITESQLRTLASSGPQFKEIFGDWQFENIKRFNLKNFIIYFHDMVELGA